MLVGVIACSVFTQKLNLHGRKKFGRLQERFMHTLATVLGFVHYKVTILWFDCSIRLVKNHNSFVHA